MSDPLLAPAGAHPLYFGAADTSSFGWYHAVGAPCRDLGVILCSPFGREELSGHRFIRTLAEQLAADGLPAMRFDYPGTGDSCLDEGASGLVARWIESVHCAADELKRLSGVTRLAIVGLRLGATLGAQASMARSDVAAFVAIEAVASGKNFVRELKAMQGHWGNDVSTDDVLEAGGFVLSAPTREELAGLDLRTLTRAPAARMLVISRDDMPDNGRWTQRLTEQGAQVQTQRLPGYADMMLDPQNSVLPSHFLSAVSTWLSQLSAGLPQVSAPRCAMRNEACFDGIRERPVTVVTGSSRLHGILSLPASTAAPLDAVLLLNAGATRRIGPNRMHVAMARRWAAQGHASLRLDLSGLGDSSVIAGTLSNVVYSPTAVSEVVSAVDYLRHEVKASRCHAVGLCSGAYHALAAAVRSAAVESVVAINPLVFFWHDGMSINSPHSDPQLTETVARYKAGLFSARRWSRVLRGKINLTRALVVISRGLKMHARHTMRDWARSLRVPLVDDLARDLQSLTQRRVSVRFVFSQNDPGNELLRAQGGRRVSQMITRGDIIVSVIPGADHTFSRREARLAFLDSLQNMFPPPKAVP